MDNVDIFIFTFLVVPSFVVFVVSTIREFAREGKNALAPDVPTKIK